MSDTNRMYKIQADFCSIMGNTKRVQIMYLLQTGERSVGELADELGASIANVSQHLRLMRDKGAVVSRKQGQQVYYSISHENFIAACTLIREGLSEIHRMNNEAFESQNEQEEIID